MGLHTIEGLRKYLTAVERDAFLCEADRADRAVRTLCMTLTYAGCRLSEALAAVLHGSHLNLFNNLGRIQRRALA